VLLVLALCGVAAPLPASGADNPPASYAVTAWTIKDGLLSGDIRAITQDADG
jgi:hypothetical protein